MVDFMNDKPINFISIFIYKLSFHYFSLNTLAYPDISCWCVVCLLKFTNDHMIICE